METLRYTKWKQNKWSFPRSDQVEFGEGDVSGSLAVGTEKHKHVVGDDVQINDCVVDCAMDGRSLKLDCEWTWGARRHVCSTLQN
jgi:hypothetical protein